MLFHSVKSENIVIKWNKKKDTFLVNINMIFLHNFICKVSKFVLHNSNEDHENLF